MNLKSLQHKKELAKERASNIIGVRSVANELTIVHTKTVIDEVLSMILMDGMKANRYIYVTTVNVNVTDANVKLTGTVRSPMERNEIYRIALYTLGVNSINNTIKVE